jgi:hypothetical protein
MQFTAPTVLNSAHKCVWLARGGDRKTRAPRAPQRGRIYNASLPKGMSVRNLGRGIRFQTLAIGAFFVAFSALALLMPAQNDTFWHLRAGQDIWLMRAIPRVDRYSHTFAGAPWPDHEWLSQALMYAVYRVAGMPGLEIGAAALVMGAAALTWRLMVGTIAVRGVLMTSGLALSSCVWVLRPHVVTLFLLAVLLTLLARDRIRWIPPLFVVWANAHGGVVLGGLILAAASAAALLRWWRVREPVDRARARTLLIVTALSGLACAAAPLGFGIYHFVIESTARSIQVKIVEWFPVKPDGVFGVLFWLSTIAFVGLLAARLRRFIRLPAAPWPDWAVVAAAVAMLPLAVRSLRNTAPFILLAAPAASRLLGEDFRAPAWLARLFARRQRPPSPDKPRLNLALLAGASVLAAITVATLHVSNEHGLGWRPIPAGALAAIRACEGPLYNQYGDGGTLIWFVPEKPVFVDGRQDPYPLPFLLEVVEVEGGRKPYQPLFDRFAVRCAFLPVGAGTVDQLGKEGWQTRYRDAQWAVLAAPPLGG